MTKVILAIAFLIFLVVIGPIITIWALNILFPSLASPFTWETWLAVVIIGGVLKSRVSVNK